MSDPAVLDLLIRRSHDGVRVVLIVPNQKDFHHYANMHAITQLLTQGDKKRIEVFLYPRVMHAKIMLIDREQAFVGSANLITSSLDEMGEVNVLLRGRMHAAIRKLREVLREDILVSTPVSRPPRFHWLWRWLMWLKL
jgi:phosphatidylserine/phosphatidylglycerophosphate/cardiolipin synthase-like enzyme